MFTMGFRSDEEEEKEDEDAAIADDAIDEIGEAFPVEELDEAVEPIAKVVAEEDDEEDVDFDLHDDVDPV